MYCGNCGKEIDDNAVFCPECGAKTEVEQTEVKKKSISPKTKKAVKIGISLIAVAAVILIGLKIFTYVQNLPSEAEIQMAVNNLNNGGIVASDGKWIYYNDNGLCKMKSDDKTNNSVISEDIEADSMFYLGKSLYYSSSGIYALKGKSGKDLGFSIFTQDCIQTDGSKFYVTGLGNYEDDGVYSCKTGNIKKGRKLSDISPTDLFLHGDYLYIKSGFDTINNVPNENFGLWRINKNGKNLISLFDYCPFLMVFCGDRMYYTNEDRILCSASLDGSDQTVFDDIKVGNGLNVSENYIFYVNYESKTIYRIDKDGNNKTELNKNKSDSLNIIGDWIFYINESNKNKIYRMSFDGSYNQPLL